MSQDPGTLSFLVIFVLVGAVILYDNKKLRDRLLRLLEDFAEQLGKMSF